MKLYQTEKPTYTQETDSGQVDFSIESELSDLSDQVYAYCSVSKVHTAVCGESLTLVDTKNQVLMSEYMTVLSHRLNVKLPSTPSLESIQESGVIPSNQTFALEGWMGDMWAKIKAAFKKLYEAVKGFFTRWLTRVGRIKGSLNNLEEFLNKTDKEVYQPTVEDPPESVLRAFSGTSDVNSSYVVSILNNLLSISQGLSSINAEADKMSKAGLVDSDYVSKIKQLRSTAESAGKASEENRTERSKTKIFGDKDKKAQLDTENKTLKDLQVSSTNEADQKDTEISQAVSGIDTSDVETDNKKAQEAFKTFLEVAVGKLNTVKGKPLPNGIKIVDIAVNEKEGLETKTEEMDISTGLTLGTKAELLKIVNLAKETLKSAEEDIKKYGDVNDAIMKGLSGVDTLVADIDKVDPEKYGKYKTVLNQVVRVRLQLMRKFFSTYNKICKNTFDMSVDGADNAAKYCVLSLKYFKSRDTTF